MEENIFIDEFNKSAADNSYYEVVSQVKNVPIDRNNRTGCATNDIPSVPTYFSAMNIYGVTLFSTGGIAVITVLILYLDTLKYIINHAPPRVKTHSAFVLGVYPVVALSVYLAMLVPRAHLLSEAVTQGIFMAAMYQLFCLFVAYCGGEAELIRRVKPNALDSRVGPCCCWPCCWWLPVCAIDKNKVKYLRLLILQLPVVQGLVYMALLVMWAERESLYQVNYLYVQPIVILSIFSGIWGISMTMRMLKEVLKDYSIFAKFFVLQMVLIFAKLQGLATRILVWSGGMPCKPPVTPTVYGNLLHNSLMLSEMVLLSIIARKLYKQELPKIVETNNNIEKVCVISTHVTTIENIMKGNIESASPKLTNK